MEKADGGKFIQIVKEHMERCSHMEPQDFGKLAFQSEFGPEHMMADRQQAESFLIEEWNSLPENNAAGIPRGGQESVLPVSESLCRFQLSKCGSVDEVKLLAHLFISTAEEHKGTVEGLEEKLEQLKELHIPSTLYLKFLCKFLRIFFRECMSKSGVVVVLRRAFLICAIGKIDQNIYTRNFDTEY